MLVMFFINDISRYITATSCDLKNEKNKKFFSGFFIFPLSSIRRRFKNKTALNEGLKLKEL